MLTDEQAREYEEKGFFIVDDAIDSQMLEELRAAAQRIAAKCRAGEADEYTDFAFEGEPYHTLGLIGPFFGESIFGQYLASPTMLGYVKELIGDQLRMSSIALMTNPRTEPFDMAWHRDSGSEPRDQPEAAELAFLRRPRAEVRWELALVDDDALGLIPGSQNRYRTDVEWEEMSNGTAAALPGQEVVQLRAGQTIFWNQKIIHRACHTPENERLTLIAGWSVNSEDQPKRDIGQFEWMLAEEVRAGLPESIRVYYDHWKAAHTA